MGPGSTGLIIAFVLCLFFSSYFSASETAFSTCNEIRLKNMANDGNKQAKKVLKITDNYDSLISAILIGNNLVNIAGTSIATVLFVRQYGDIGATLSTVFTTVVVLIFGEISPKSVAKETPEKFAMATADFMRFIIIIFTPLVFLFGLWKKLLKKVFKLENEDTITEDEFLTMVDEAEQDGGIDAEDSELIKTVIEFNDQDAADILTPRVDVIAASLEDSNEEIKALFEENEYSRLPVYEGDVDNIIGFIHQRDFYTYVLSGSKILSEIINPVMFVAPNTKISKILTDLQQKHLHMAVVTDEFGGTDGILTMEDILEELVGEIYDEHDEEIQLFEKMSENEYKVVCNADIEDMFKFLSVDFDTESSTVSGWVLEQLGKIPEVGDSFDYENLHVEVIKTDSRRVLEIKVVVNEEEDEDEKPQDDE